MELINFILHVDTHLAQFAASNGALIYGLLFLIVFVAIAIRTFLPSRSRELDAAARLPLEDEPVLRPSLQER